MRLGAARMQVSLIHGSFPYAGGEVPVSQEVVPSLSLTVVQQVLWTVLRVSGDLAWESHDRFDDCVSEIVNSTHEPRLCIDLSRLDYCDSSGIASILRAWRAATSQGGRLIVLRPSKHLADKLVMLGLDGRLPILDLLTDGGWPR